MRTVALALVASVTSAVATSPKPVCALSVPRQTQLLSLDFSFDSVVIRRKVPLAACNELPPVFLWHEPRTAKYWSKWLCERSPAQPRLREAAAELTGEAARVAARVAARAFARWRKHERETVLTARA